MATTPNRLVQTRVHDAAGDALEHKAGGEGLSVAAYVRRLIYKDLGFMPSVAGASTKKKGRD